VNVATRPSDPAELGTAGRDVRASRPYLLTRGTIANVVRRLVAIVVLALLDAAGVALGLYAALVLRSFVFGDPIFWNLLWETGPAEWLPFLIPITWLVFWQAGLYASRERRSGFGRIASSLLLVALITLAFGWGTDYDFTTSGLIPTAWVASALVVGGLRAAYESLTLEMQRLLNVRRRVLLVGEGEHLAQLHRSLAATRRLLAYDLVGSFAPGEGQVLDEWLARLSPDEIILNEGDLREDLLLDLVETAHRAGVRVRIAPRTTELLLERGEYVPGQGAPLFELRPPIFAGAC
jgi:FlaA1/EpsC-like NDP-sugar epimerase